METSVSLLSTDTDWDYVKFQPGSARLFMARIKDGLTVFDADTNRSLATIANSSGANGPLLLPDHNRGYVAMDDGSLLSFELDSLKLINRVVLTKDGGLNSGILDRATGRIHFITSSRPVESTWFTLNPATGKLLSQIRFPFRKMDDPAGDDTGHLFAPVRYDQMVLQLDARTLREQARWKVGCNVSKLRYDNRSQRLVGACGGDQPSVFILDPKIGKVTARVTIGKGIDAMIIDRTRERIVTSNGEGSMTIIRYDGGDGLDVIGTIPTRVGARMMDIDQRTGKLYLVSADSTIFPTKDGAEAVTRYHDDSFRVEVYTPL
ncbi:hypothetical protein WP12_10730 [Sphingomonas sp. SRS2]|nr:hypothetical protein WP12_10730 [Sphingomonas sp. SRS2]